jgi:hypothetical protein
MIPLAPGTPVSRPGSVKYPESEIAQPGNDRSCYEPAVHPALPDRRQRVDSVRLHRTIQCQLSPKRPFASTGPNAGATMAYRSPSARRPAASCALRKLGGTVAGASDRLVLGQGRTAVTNTLRTKNKRSCTSSQSLGSGRSILRTSLSHGICCLAQTRRGSASMPTSGLCGVFSAAPFPEQSQRSSNCA